MRPKCIFPSDISFPAATFVDILPRGSFGNQCPYPVRIK